MKRSISVNVIPQAKAACSAQLRKWAAGWPHMPVAKAIGSTRKTSAGSWIQASHGTRAGSLPRRRRAAPKAKKRP